MRVKIYKGQLLRQLPRDVQATLVASHDLPDVFEFDVFDIMDQRDIVHDGEKSGVMKVNPKWEKQYPQVKKVLTQMQWFMFSVMLENPDGADCRLLGALSRSTPSRLSNTVAALMVGLRRALMVHDLPFKIKTTQQGILTPGMYSLIHL